MLVPNLQDHLADAAKTSDEQVTHITDMVLNFYVLPWNFLTLSIHSCRKVPMEPDPMTRRASRLLRLFVSSDKSTIIDWITPCDQPLIPPLHHNQKFNRSFNHKVLDPFFAPLVQTGKIQSRSSFILTFFKRTNSAIISVKNKLKEGIHVVLGDQWPIFMWKDEKYDESDPWKGLL